jgi:hypothetical protein
MPLIRVAGPFDHPDGPVLEVLAFFLCPLDRERPRHEAPVTMREFATLEELH